MKRYPKLVLRYEETSKRFVEINECKFQAKVSRARTDTFLDVLKEQVKLIDEFDENLWNVLLDTATMSVGGIVFTFKNGMEISFDNEAPKQKSQAD